MICGPSFMNYDQNNQGIRAIITILYKNILVTFISHIKKMFIETSDLVSGKVRKYTM